MPQEEAADTLVVETVEDVIESAVSDISSEVETVVVIDEIIDSKRESTFLTEIDDTEEVQLVETDNEKLDQLEKSIEQSEEEFPSGEDIGEIVDITTKVEEIQLVEFSEQDVIGEITQIEKVNETEIPKDETVMEEVTSSTEIGCDLLVDSVEDVKSVGDPLSECVIQEEPQEMMKSDYVLEDIIDISAKQIDNTEIEAHELAVAEDIAEEKMDKAFYPVTEDYTETEKIPIGTIAMVTYVIFMALIIFFH